MTKNVMSGGYNDQEARNLLLIRGIEHVKGIIPHKVPKNANLAEFEDFAPIWFDSIFHDVMISYSYEYDDGGYSMYDDIYHGIVHGINIGFDAKLCWKCSVLIRDYYNAISPTIRIDVNYGRHYCELCGKWEDDDIPF